MNITEKMQRNAQKYRERLEETRSDWTLSDAAKRHEIQAAFEEARTTHARLAEEYCAGVRERLGRSRKAAFAAPKIAGSDIASELMAYRDDLDRVSRITDTRTLSEMLARAETVGDVPPVRAVLYGVTSSRARPSSAATSRSTRRSNRRGRRSWKQQRSTTP